MMRSRGLNTVMKKDGGRSGEPREYWLEEME